MASEERQAANKQINEQNLHNSLGAKELQAETDAFQCGRCKNVGLLLDCLFYSDVNINFTLCSVNVVTVRPKPVVLMSQWLYVAWTPFECPSLTFISDIRYVRIDTFFSFPFVATDEDHTVVLYAITGTLIFRFQRNVTYSVKLSRWKFSWSMFLNARVQKVFMFLYYFIAKIP